ncbi:MAG: hypothetical protein DRP87_07915 [Spirochaetes bacterium]|nr:MAG: hypothetical protein DRP87_07915 [Spirochaetota bacterium]
MESAFAKGLFAGIGLTLKTKDKIVELGKKVADELGMNEEKGRKFVQRILDQSEDVKQKIEDIVDKEVDEAFKRLDIAKKEEMMKLEAKIEELEKEIKALKKSK